MLNQRWKPFKVFHPTTICQKPNVLNNLNRLQHDWFADIFNSSISTILTFPLRIANRITDRPQFPHNHPSLSTPFYLPPNNNSFNHRIFIFVSYLPFPFSQFSAPYEFSSFENSVVTVLAVATFGRSVHFRPTHFFTKSWVKGNVFEIPCSHYFIRSARLFYFMDFGWKARTFSKCSLMQPFHSVLLARGVFCLLYLQLCLVSFSSLLFFIPLSFVCTAAYAWVFRMRHTSLSGRIRISDT